MRRSKSSRRTLVSASPAGFVKSASHDQRESPVNYNKVTAVVERIYGAIRGMRAKYVAGGKSVFCVALVVVSVGSISDFDGNRQLLRGQRWSGSRRISEAERLRNPRPEQKHAQPIAKCGRLRTARFATRDGMAKTDQIRRDSRARRARREQLAGRDGFDADARIGDVGDASNGMRATAVSIAAISASSVLSGARYLFSAARIADAVRNARAAMVSVGFAVPNVGKSPLPAK